MDDYYSLTGESLNTSLNQEIKNIEDDSQEIKNIEDFISNPSPSSPTTGLLPSDKVHDDFFHDDIATSLPFPTNIGLEPDEFQDNDQRELCGLGDSLPSSAPADDGYNWTKYGEKLVEEEYLRFYYKCTHKNCEARKKVDHSREGHITEIIYKGTHHHTKPRPNCSGIDGTEQTRQDGFAGTNEKLDESKPKRRKRKDSAARIVVEVPSDIEILDDGYRWRKYGDKVIKGNPNPRRYYRCTAKGCTVTKHVERAPHDFKNVLTTYIGRHNHIVPPATRSSSHVGSGTLQDSLVSEGLVTAPFGFQSHMGPPGSSYIVQPQISSFLMPGLANGEEMLPSPPAPALGDPDSRMLLFASKPQVEQPMSQSEQGLLKKSLIYSELMGMFPRI